MTFNLSLLVSSAAGEIVRDLGQVTREIVRAGFTYRVTENAALVPSSNLVLIRDGNDLLVYVKGKLAVTLENFYGVDGAAVQFGDSTASIVKSSEPIRALEDGRALIWQGGDDSAAAVLGGGGGGAGGAMGLAFSAEALAGLAAGGAFVLSAQGDGGGGLSSYDTNLVLDISADPFATDGLDVVTSLPATASVGDTLILTLYRDGVAVDTVEHVLTAEEVSNGSATVTVPGEQFGTGGTYTGKGTLTDANDNVKGQSEDTPLYVNTADMSLSLFNDADPTDGLDYRVALPDMAVAGDLIQVSLFFDGAADAIWQSVMVTLTEADITNGYLAGHIPQQEIAVDGPYDGKAVLFDDQASSKAYTETPGFFIVFNGVVQDDYFAGASVFVDSNRDGMWNEGEAIVQTKEDGTFYFAVDTGGAPILAMGGVDTASGAANQVSVYRSFQLGAVAQDGLDIVLSPLTTLAAAIAESQVGAGGVVTESTLRAAAEKIKVALGLDESVSADSLLRADPIAANNATVGGSPVDAAIVAANRQLSLLVTATGALVDGAVGSGTRQGSALAMQQVAKIVVDNLAGQTQVNLADQATVKAVFSNTMTQANTDGLTEDLRASDDADLESIATVVAGMSARIGDATKTDIGSTEALNTLRAAYDQIVPALSDAGSDAQSERGGDLSLAGIITEMSQRLDDGADAYFDALIADVTGTSGTFETYTAAGYVGEYIHLDILLPNIGIGQSIDSATLSGLPAGLKLYHVNPVTQVRRELTPDAEGNYVFDNPSDMGFLEVYSESTEAYDDLSTTGVFENRLRVTGSVDGEPTVYSGNVQLSIFDRNIVPVPTITLVSEDDGALASGDVTRDRMLELEGSLSSQLSAFQRVVIYAGDTALGRATIGVDGLTFSYAMSTQLADGTHNLVARVVEVRNGAGTLVSASPRFIVNVESLSTWIAGVFDSDADGKPEISGSTEPGATVTITTPDGQTFTSLADGSGNYSLELRGVNPTTGTYSVTSTDDGGNTSAPSTVSASDLTSPDAPGTPQITDDDGDGRPEVQGTAEPNSTVTITSPDGQTFTAMVDASGNYSTELRSVSPITGTYSVTATDEEGNTSEPSWGNPGNVSKPVSPPDLTAASDDGVSNTDDKTSNTTPDLSLGGLPEGMVDVQVRVDGEVITGSYDPDTGIFTPTNPLTPGEHQITYRYIDGDGGVGAPSDALSIYVLPPAPTSTPDMTGDSDDGVSNSDDITSATTPEFDLGQLPTGSVDVQVWVDGEVIAGAYDATSGIFTPSSPLDLGAHEIAFRYVDDSGQVGPLGDSLTIHVVDHTAIFSAQSIDLLSFAPVALNDSVDLEFVVLRTHTGSAASVHWTLEGLNAEFFSAGVLPSGDLDFASGESQKTLIVTVSSTAARNIAGTASLVLSDPTGGFLLDPDNFSAQAVIDEAVAYADPTVTSFQVISNRPESLDEGDSTASTTVTFTVKRTGGDIASARDVDVTLSATGQSLISAADFAAGQDTLGSNGGLPSGTLRFAAGATTATFAVVIKGDNLVGPDESFVLNLGVAAGESVTGALVTTVANDDADISVGLLAGDVPDEISHAFVIRRTGATDREHTVSWSLSSAGELGQDNLAELLDMALSGDLTFAVGETEKTITVPRIDNIAVDATQTFALNLTAAADSDVNLVNASAISTILPNLQEVAVVAEFDRALEGTDGLRAAGEFVYTVTRTGATDQASTISWAIRGAGETPVSGADFDGGVLPSGEITFAAGETSAEIRFSPAMDGTLEGDEGFVLALSASDPAIRVLTPTIEGALIDDESAVGFSQTAAFSAIEGDDAASYLNAIVTRIGFVGDPTTVEWRVSPDSATLADFAAGQDSLGDNNGFPSGTVTLLPGEASGTVRVQLTTDSVLENNETFTITLANPSGATMLIGEDASYPGYGKSAQATIVNDDSVLSFARFTQQQVEDHGGSTNMMAITVLREGSTVGTDWVRWSLVSSGDNAADYVDVGGDPSSAQAVFSQTGQSWIDLVDITGKQAESGQITLTKGGYIMVAYDRSQSYDSDYANQAFDQFLLKNLSVSEGASLSFFGDVAARDYVANDLAVTSGNGSLFAPDTAVTLPGGVAQHVTISSTNALGGMKFRVTGIDADGNEASELVLGPDAGGSVRTETAFLSVSSIDSVPATVTLGVLPHAQTLYEPEFENFYQDADWANGVSIDLAGDTIGYAKGFNNSSGVTGAARFTDWDEGQLIIQSDANLTGVQLVVHGGVQIASFSNSYGPSNPVSSSFYQSGTDYAQFVLPEPTVLRFEQVAGVLQTQGSDVAPEFVILGRDVNGNDVRETLAVPDFDADGVATIVGYEAASGNALSQSQTLTDAGRVMISIDGTASTGGLLFTITGTDDNGNAISDIVKFPANTSEFVNATFGTAKEFATVDSIVANKDFSDTFTVGVSQPVYTETEFAVVFGIAPSSANTDSAIGRVEVTVEHSFTFDGTVAGSHVLEPFINFVRSIEVLPSLEANATIDVGFEVPHRVDRPSSFNFDMDVAAFQDTAVTAINSLRDGYELDYSDLESDYWDDAGDDIYDEGNYLSIGGVEQSIWNTDNTTTPTAADFGTYVYRTATSGTALLIQDYQGGDFEITGELGADSDGVKERGTFSPAAGVTVVYEIIRGSGDPSLHKILVTDARHPVLADASADTDTEDFRVSGLADASFVQYYTLASNDTTYYTVEEISTFVQGMLGGSGEWQSSMVVATDELTADIAANHSAYVESLTHHVLSVRDFAVDGVSVGDTVSLDSITLTQGADLIEVNTGSAESPVWAALSGTSLEVSVLEAGGYRIAFAGAVDAVMGDVSTLQSAAVAAIDALPNGYAMDYSDLYSDYWSDGGDDTYDSGNYLAIDDVDMALWNTDNNETPTAEDFGTYVFRTTTSGTALLIQDFNGDTFQISGSLGADGSGYFDRGVIKDIPGISVVYDVIRGLEGEEEGALHKIVITDAQNVVVSGDTSDTDDEDFMVSGLSTASFVHYFTFVTEFDGDQSLSVAHIRDFALSMLPEQLLTANLTLDDSSVIDAAVSLEAAMPRDYVSPQAEGLSSVSATEGLTTSGGSDIAYAVFYIDAPNASPDAPITLSFDMEVLGRAGVDVASLAYAPEGAWSTSNADAVNSTHLLADPLTTSAVYTVMGVDHFQQSHNEFVDGFTVQSVSNGTMEVNIGTAEEAEWIDVMTYIDQEASVIAFSLVEEGMVRYTGNSVTFTGYFTEEGSEVTDFAQRLSALNPEPHVMVPATAVGSATMTDSGYIWVRYSNEGQGFEGNDQALINSLSVSEGTLSVVGQRVLTQGVAQEQTLGAAGSLDLNGSSVVAQDTALTSGEGGDLYVFVSRDDAVGNLPSGAYTAVGQNAAGDTITLEGAWTHTDIYQGWPVGFSDGMTVRLSGLDDLVRIESLRIHEFDAATRDAVEDWGDNTPYQYSQPVVSLARGDYDSLSSGVEFDTLGYSDWDSVSARTWTTTQEKFGDQSYVYTVQTSRVSFTDGAVTGSQSVTSYAKAISFGAWDASMLDGATVQVTGTDSEGNAQSETLTFGAGQHLISTAQHYFGTVNFVFTSPDVNAGQFLVFQSRDVATEFGDPQGVIVNSPWGFDEASLMIAGLDINGDYQELVVNEIQANHPQELGVFTEIFAVQPLEPFEEAYVYLLDAPDGEYSMYREVALDGTPGLDGLIDLGGEQRVVICAGEAYRTAVYKVVGEDAQGNAIEEFIYGIATMGQESGMELDGSAAAPNASTGNGVFGITEQYFAKVQGVYVSVYHPNEEVNTFAIASIGTIGRPLVEDQAVSPYGEVLNVGGQPEAVFDTDSKLSFASDDDLSDRTFTVTGTLADGSTVTEVVFGPSASIVLTNNAFMTVSSVEFSDGAAGSVKVGYVTRNGGLTDNFVVTGSGTDADPFFAYSTNTHENNTGAAIESFESNNEADILFYLDLSTASGPVTLSYDLSVQGAAGQDVLTMEFSPNVPPILEGTLKFADGEDSATILIPIVGDDTPEADETMLLKLGASSVGTTVDQSANETTLTIVDDDDTVSLTSATASAAEGNDSNGAFTFTVTRLQADGDKEVAWNLTGLDGEGKASADDFVATSGTVTFLDGELSATITVETVGDRVLEADETFTFMLSTPAEGCGYVLNGTTSANAVIRNDDVRVSIVATTTSLAEGGDHVFTVTREGDLSQVSEIDWAVSASDAEDTVGAQASDFGAALPSGTITFAAGAVGSHNTETQTITITSANNTDYSGDVSFDVTLANASGDATDLGQNNVAQGVIFEDDALVLTTTDPAQGEGTNVIAAGEFGATTLTYNLTRAGDVSRALTVDWAVELTGTSSAGRDDFAGSQLPYGTVTFAAGSATATITLDVTADDYIERDDTFQLVFTADATTPATAEITATIVGDELGFGVDVESVNVDEGNSGLTPITVTLVRSGSSDVPAEYGWVVRGEAVVGESDAAAGADFDGAALPSGTVSFAIGESAKDVTVYVVADSVYSNNRSFVVDMVQDPAGTPAVVASSEVVTITNDDARLSLTVDLAQFFEGSDNTNVYESRIFTVSREGNTAQVSTVDWHVGASSGLTIDDFVGASDALADNGGLPSGTVTFAAGETSQTFVLKVRRDSLLEGDETIAVTLSNASVGSSIDTAVASTVVTNDDVAVTITSVSIDGGASQDPSAISIQEGDFAGPYSSLAGSDADFTLVTYTVERAQGKTDQYSEVTWSIAGATAADFVGATTGTLTWQSGDTSAQTVVVKVRKDLLVENTENFTLQFNAVSAGTDTSTAHANLTVLDEDTGLFLASGSSLMQRVVEGQDGTATLTWTLERRGDTSQALDVAYQVSGANYRVNEADNKGGIAGAADAADFGGTFPSGVVSFGAGESTATITVTVTGDLDAEGTETFKVALLPTTGIDEFGVDRGYRDGNVYAYLNNNTAQYLQGTIVRDESIVHVAAVKSDTDLTAISKAVETDGEYTSLFFKVYRTLSTSNDVTVDWKVSGNSNFGYVEFDPLFFQATRTSLGSADDYVTADTLGTNSGLPSGTVTIADGETYAVVEVRVAADTTAQDLRGLTLTISNVSNGATLGTSSTSVDLLDNDPLFSIGLPAPTVATPALAQGSHMWHEDDGNLVYRVYRTGDTSGSATVDWSLDFTTDAAIPGGATDADSVAMLTRFAASAEDFSSPTSGTLVFADGEAYKEITLALVDDAVAENFAETFRVTLANPQVTEAGSTKVATVSELAGSMKQVIIDNDAGSTVGITNVVTSEGGLSFFEGSAGDAAKTVTYTLTRSGTDLSAGHVGWYIEGVNVVGVSGDTSSSAKAGLVWFAQGETTKTLTLTLSNDNTVETDSLATLKLVSASDILANYNDVDAQNGVRLFGLDAPYFGSDGLGAALSFGLTLADSATTFLTNDSEHTGLLPASGSIEVDADKASASVTLVNDDTRIMVKPMLGWQDGYAAYQTVWEGDSGTSDLTFTLTREGRLDTTLTVAYEIIAGTAADGSDIHVSSGTLTLDAVVGGSSLGSKDYAFTLSDVLIGDMTPEADEQFVVRFSNIATDALSNDTVYFQQVGSEAQNIVTRDMTVKIVNDDVQWSLSSASATTQAETDSGTVVYTMTVTRESVANGYAGAATVNWAVTGSGDHGADANDFKTAMSGSLSFAAGEVTKTFNIEVKGDKVAEYSEGFSVALTSANRGQVIGTPLDFTITNDDTGIRISDATVVEGDSGTATLSFDITRFGSLTNATSGNWDVVNTTTSDVDFDGGVKPTGNFTFAADANYPEYGEQVQTITVDVVGDIAVEGNATFKVNLSALTNITDPTVNDLTGVGTVENDDTLFSISAGTPVAEGDATGQLFTITRSKDTAQSQTVTWTVGTPGGSHGVAQDDFGTYPTGVVTFAPGELSKEVYIVSSVDATAEVDEAFTVTLTAGAGVDAAEVSAAIAYGMIVNDDVGEVIVTPDATLVVSDAAAVIEEHDGTVYAEFTVTRGGALDYSASVDWTVVATANASDNADAADFGGTLPSGTLFMDGGKTTFTIRVPISGDSSLEGNETFNLVLSNPSPGVEFATPGDETAGGVITNDDSRFDIDGAVTAYGSATPVTEGTNTTTQLSFTVTRTGDSTAAVTVDWDVAHKDSDAAFGVGDFVGSATAPSGTLSFASGETSKVVTLNIATDAVPEFDETYRIKLTNPSEGTTVGAFNSFFKIVNDDADTMKLSSEVSLLDESGEDGYTVFTFTVTRGSDLKVATLDWTVTGTGDHPLDTTRLDASTGTVLFAAGERTQVVELRIANDVLGDFDRGFTVTLSNPQQYLSYTDASTNVVDAVTPQLDADATSMDFSLGNDDPAYRLVVNGDGRFVEGDIGGGALVQFTVYRDGDASGAATLDWSVSADGANPANLSDFGGYWPSGTVAFADGETEKLVQAKISGDGTYEVDEGFKVTLSNLASEVTGARILIDSASGVIANDDNGVLVSNAGSNTVVEGDTGSTTMTFNIDVVGVAGETVGISYVVEGFGENPGNVDDFASGYGSGTFSVLIGVDGTGRQTVAVAVAGDTTFGGDENVRLRVTSVTNGALARSEGVFTIVNDDSLVSVSRAAGETSTVLEGTASANTVSYVITRSGDTTRAAVVDYEVIGAGDNQAMGADFVGGVLPSGTLTFAANETEKTVTLTLVNDADFESTEGFIFRLLQGTAPDATTNAAAIDLGAGQLRTDIVNDDSASINVIAVRDTVSEGTQGSNALIYRVVRNGSVEEALEVSYVLGAFSDADRTVSLSNAPLVEALTGSVTIPAGSDSVDILFNTVPNAEPGSNVYLSLQVTAPGFSDPAAMQGAVLDDDSGISASLSAASLDEASATFTITFSRSHTSGADEVAWSLRGAGVNPVSAGDFAGNQLPSGTAVFADGEATASVTFSFADDAVVELTEGFVIDVAATGATVQPVLTSSLQGTVADNDVITEGADEVALGNGSSELDALAGDDVIFAGAGADVIHGGEGNDTIWGGGGMDQLFGDAGDDQIHLGDLALDATALLQWHVDGGPGLDTLVFDQVNGSALNLDQLLGEARISGLEILDLNGNAASLSAAGLAAATTDAFDTDGAPSTSGFQQLAIKGATTLTLTDAADWTMGGTYSSGGTAFQVYSNSNFELLIEDGTRVV